jgi:hypothetical protein
VACHIPLKRSWRRLQLCFELNLNWGSAHKIMGLQSCESLNFEKSWSHGTKWHLGASPMVKHREYYKGEGGGFFKSGLWWVLWVHVCPWFVHAPKVLNYALTNLLFGLFIFVWIVDLFVILPSPYPRAPTHPSTPEVLRTRERTPTLHSFVVFTLNSHLNILKSLRMRHNIDREW